MEPYIARNMLDRYILDYMRRRRLRTSSACFNIEARVGDDPPAIEGLLEDWWDVFYNSYVFSTTQNRGHTFLSGNVLSNLQTRSPTNQQLALPQTFHHPIHSALGDFNSYANLHNGQSGNIVSSNPQTQTPANQQLALPQTFHHPIHSALGDFNSYADLHDGQSGNIVSSNPQTQSPANQQLALPQTFHHPIHSALGDFNFYANLHNGQSGNIVSSNPQTQTPANQQLALPQTFHHPIHSALGDFNSYADLHDGQSGNIVSSNPQTQSPANQQLALPQTFQVIHSALGDSISYANLHNGQSGNIVSSNPQTQSPANQQLALPQTSQVIHSSLGDSNSYANFDQLRLTQSDTATSRMRISPPLNVAQQDDDDDDDSVNQILYDAYFPDMTNTINISSTTSDESQTSSERDSLSRLIPRGVPLTHFLDEFPQETQTCKPESSLPEKQQGTSDIPVKVFRKETRHQTMGQLRLRPKLNKGGDVAKDEMSIEKDDLIPESHLSKDENVANNSIQMFSEVVTFFTSKDEVLCCHFSSDGKLLATAGNDKMVSVWNVVSLSHLGNTPQQSNMITDVRFMPHSTVFATSSSDTTIRLWDATDVSKLLAELHGHVDQVISVDFNPHDPKILCSCDCNGEVRLWNINELACISTSKGDRGMRQVRFGFRNQLAVSSGNMILMVDIEIKTKECLKGHTREITSICWDQSGSYLASVSEDSARVWSTNSGWKCDYEFYSTHMFSCTFHPLHSLLLVIGCFQMVEFWNCVKGSKMHSIQIHGGIISALSYSPKAELIASTSNDGHIRLWKII